MRLLITGANGQLGNELKRCLQSGRAEIGAIPAAYESAQVDFIDREMLDITDSSAIQSWFKLNGPYDVVINCAAYTNVDGCEAHEQDAYAVNAEGARLLACATQACGGKFVHVSTDYVFPGTDETPRRESDATGPVSAYGRTKLAGEAFALAECERTFIVRTAWLYGYVGKNFVKTMLSLAQKSGEITVVADQIGNPTNANDLAYEILALALTDDYGIYHVTGEGICSWYDFACAIVDKAGIACKKQPLSSDEYAARFPQTARRPLFSALENAHLSETVGNEMRLWQEALDSYISNLAALGESPAFNPAI